MQIIAAFDFDGTITTKDTLWEFLKFSQSKIRLYSGLFLLSPALVLYLLKIISNDKAKEILFSWFFKSWSLSKFNVLCEDFSSQIERMLRPETMRLLREHQEQGHQLFSVSASVENWIIPWAEKFEITVLATQIEVDTAQKLTGKFKSENCYGQEKVNRLLAALPDRKSYYLYVYGDSKGDKEMVNFGDEGYIGNPSPHIIRQPVFF
jgi:HAD superfamily hydrolase (TIGR01490 family)